MAAISITITNLPEIKAAFRKAPSLMKNELNTAIKKTVLTIQASSMRNTPVRTGRLRGSTSSEFADLKGQVGTHTNYDVYVHNGTRYMKARPYLKDAVDQENEITQRFFYEAVNNTLSKIARAI